MWENARTIDRPSGMWELLGKDEPCAVVDGVRYYWCALRRRGGWRIFSGVLPLPPQSTAEDELLPALNDVVSRCREMW